MFYNLYICSTQSVISFMFRLSYAEFLFYSGCIGRNSRSKRERERDRGRERDRERERERERQATPPTASGSGLQGSYF